MIPKRSILALAKALEGVPILGVLPGSPAARAGIGYGDILLSVNGTRTRNVVEYVEAKALRDDGMDVVVFRAGSEQLVDLRFDAPGTPVDPASLLAELVALRLAGGEDGLDGPANEGGGLS